MPITSFSVYSSGAAVVASSSSANLQFGIVARVIRIQNFGSADMWVKFSPLATLGTTGIATTNDAQVGTCSDHRLQEFYFDRTMGPLSMSVMTTSTAATQHRNISAWGEA